MAYVTLPFVDAVIKASVILAATALLAAALRRSSASARHLVWTLGLMSALAAPVLSLAVPRWELPLVRISAPAAAVSDSPSASPVQADLQRPVHRAETSGATAPAASATEASTGAPVRSSLSAAWLTASAGRLLFVLWLAGAAIILGRMLLGLAAVQSMSRRMPIVTAAPWLAQAETLARGLGLTRTRFLRTATSSMPMAWGVIRPSVLMPADADTWPTDRLRIVLLHELAHVKRRDCLTHLFAQVACAAYWFNPLAWMAVRKLRAERERACDDLVLAAGTRGSDYADQLLEIARVMHAGRFPAVLAGASLAMAHRSQLEGRLMAILDPNVPRRGLSRARSLSAVLLFAILIVPVASVQPWAKEPAAAWMLTADMMKGQQAPVPQPKPAADAPIESYPGQAAADNATNAAAQSSIQNRIQGQLQNHLQNNLQNNLQDGPRGGVRDGIAAGVDQGIGAGVARGVAQGLAGGTAQGIAGGVAGGVGRGVGVGVGNGIASGIEVDVQSDKQKDKDKEKDKDVDGGQPRERDPRTATALVEALKDTDKSVRETALEALVQMRDPRIFDPLVVALKDASAEIRQEAAFGLGQLRDARAVEPLAGVLKDASADVRQQAVFALGQLRATSAVDALSSMLHDTSADVREQAVFALGQIRDHRSVEPLISALKDEKPDVRQQAAFSLGQIRDAKAVEALVIALKDASAEVRQQAAFALGQIRDARGIDGLTLALKDPVAAVRQQAAFALGQIR